MYLHPVKICPWHKSLLLIGVHLKNQQEVLAHVSFPYYWGKKTTQCTHYNDLLVKPLPTRVLYAPVCLNVCVTALVLYQQARMHKLTHDLEGDHRLLASLRNQVMEMDRNVMERRKSRNSAVSVSYMVSLSLQA